MGLEHVSFIISHIPEVTQFLCENKYSITNNLLGECWHLRFSHHLMCSCCQNVNNLKIILFYTFLNQLCVVLTSFIVQYWQLWQLIVQSLFSAKGLQWLSHQVLILLFIHWHFIYPFYNSIALIAFSFFCYGSFHNRPERSFSYMLVYVLVNRLSTSVFSVWKEKQIRVRILFHFMNFKASHCG